VIYELLGLKKTMDASSCSGIQLNTGKILPIFFTFAWLLQSMQSEVKVKVKINEVSLAYLSTIP
jgi:hypothetical protein